MNIIGIGVKIHQESREILMNKEERIKNNLELQERLSKSLLQNHCLGAFIALLDSGRELELKYREVLFSITRAGKNLIISTKENSYSYTSTYELLLCAKIANQYVIGIWDDIEIKTLF